MDQNNIQSDVTASNEDEDIVKIDDPGKEASVVYDKKKITFMDQIGYYNLVIKSALESSDSENDQEKKTTDNNTSKGKGKQKAMAVIKQRKHKQDMETSDNNGKDKTQKDTITQSVKYVPTIDNVKRNKVQTLLNRVDTIIQEATLGYALMTVMDDNDLGRGPTMEQQKINLSKKNCHTIRPSGDKIIGLQETVICAEQAIIQDGVWLACFVDLDLISKHTDCAFDWQKTTCCQTHQDSNNDALHTIMNILLGTEDADA
ncbi:hypothetical protein EV363DRAFT_1294388 [Boletus edulis]|nr:hypothetical protein EV363DRAFT_1294388 [Boletus edulis]